jgi:hypothetical protein
MFSSSRKRGVLMLLKTTLHLSAHGWGTGVGFPWGWFEIQIREFDHIFEASFFQSNA